MSYWFQSCVGICLFLSHVSCLPGVVVDSRGYEKVWPNSRTRVSRVQHPTMHCPCMRISPFPHFGSISAWNNQCWPAVEHQLKNIIKTKNSLKTNLKVGIAGKDGFRAKFWSWISWVMHGGIKNCPVKTGSNVMSSMHVQKEETCHKQPEIDVCLTWKPPLQTSLLGMCILEFSGIRLFGYSGFRFQPDLMKMIVRNHGTWWLAPCTIPAEGLLSICAIVTELPTRNVWYQVLHDSKEQWAPWVPPWYV
jgi:hypothetical protein